MSSSAANFATACLISRIDARAFVKQLVIRPACKGRREINRRVAPGQLVAAAQRVDRIQDDLFRQIHHRLVVAERLVHLQHRELWIVSRADPFVAIDASQFVDAFHAADQQSLQMQFKRDPHEQIDVQGIVMRDKGSSRRPAGDRMQCGAFDFAKLLLGQRSSNRMRRSLSDQESVARRLRCRSDPDTASAVAARDPFKP